jgi:hypothetical protein
LIVEGSREFPVNFNASHDTGDFVVCLNAIDRAKFREPYERFAERCIAGIALAINDYRASQSKLIAEAFYCEREKPIFLHHLEAGGVSVSVAVPFDEGLAANVSANARRLSREASIERVTTLLNAARNESEPFKAFILASGAFDLFFRGQFERYRKDWFQRKKAQEHLPVSKLFERLESFAEGQYAVLDCFIIVAATLDPIGAGKDYEEMRAVNKFRNDMVHRPDPRNKLFPTEQILDVVSKYVRLHLQLG